LVYHHYPTYSTLQTIGAYRWTYYKQSIWF
jgi:hypothetical protein